MEYIRVGTDYFKIAEKPLLSGDKITTLIKWNKGEIITDHGKEYIEAIPKYDGFVTIPNNKKYMKVVNGFYNEYHQIDHVLTKGKFDKTKEFLKHIFGEQYELGIDYLTILWHKPTQILPILCLVSEDRKTGKTTFLNWLKSVFQKNMTINKNEDFRSRFNSDWATKLIVAIDEVLLDKREDSERIKNLSTSNTFKTEHKGKDKIETPFFGKFILCSNNEDSFILIDEKEIRYWVRKIPSISNENENTELLEDLEKEIPSFLYYINHREATTAKTTRMWFSKDDIQTEALTKLVSGNKNYLHKELVEILKDEFDMFEKDELKYSVSDLVEKLKHSNLRATRTSVSKMLKEKFKLESINSSYTKYHLSAYPNSKNEFYIDETSTKGRHYVFCKKDLV